MAMGRFVRGFLIGAPIGAAIVLFVTPTSGRAVVQGISERITTAVEAGQLAAALHEQQMWDQLRRQLKRPEAEDLPAPLAGPPPAEGPPENPPA
jgi:gas vesicle protein